MMRHSRKTAVAVLFAGIAVSGGLAAGAAQADPNQAVGYQWCPGQAVPLSEIRWDMNVCHTYYIVPSGTGNVEMVDLQGNQLDSWIAADIPAPVFAPPPPPAPLPPGTPFCTPRGALIIIPPICDEIGIDNPPGSVRS